MDKGSGGRVVGVEKAAETKGKNWVEKWAWKTQLGQTHSKFDQMLKSLWWLQS